MRWLSGAGLILALGSAGAIGFYFLRGKEWRATAAARWLLLVALFILPSTTMLAGNVVGFHRTKQSCTQCHTMDPWVADMTDPMSKTLAAVHYQNRLINEDQCYTCHSGYGLGGNIKAKMGGLSHVLHYYFLGVPLEIKIHEPFPPSTCLHCHADTAKYLKVDQHVDSEMKPKIESGALSCFECHAAPHPRAKK